LVLPELGIDVPTMQMSRCTESYVKRGADSNGGLGFVVALLDLLQSLIECLIIDADANNFMGLYGIDLRF
jgi:hypothetical protein